MTPSTAENLQMEVTLMLPHSLKSLGPEISAPNKLQYPRPPLKVAPLFAELPGATSWRRRVVGHQAGSFGMSLVERFLIVHLGSLHCSKSQTMGMLMGEQDVYKDFVL